MSSTLEEVEKSIELAISKGFRGRLLDRGLARSMIWVNGILPEGAPSFSEELSYDLLSYGYSLLTLAFQLKDLNGDENLCSLAFERSATAIADTIQNGDSKSNMNEFHIIVSASAYHLGHYAAKAYSLLQKRDSIKNTNIIEDALSLLILRDLNSLESLILEWKSSGKGSDESIAREIESRCQNFENEESLSNSEEFGINSIEIPVVDIAITDNYLSAIYEFLVLLETGRTTLLENTIQRLETCQSACAELNLLSQWWIVKITKYFIKDLWESSLHNIIPKHLDEESSSDWESLRWLYIISLLKRKKSEIELWPSQIEGGKRSINETDDLVISLPTSAGKTKIAELCILRSISLGKRVLYITPLRALSAQTESSLRKTFHPLGVSVTSLYGSIGASNFEQDILKNRDIVVGTPEKLDFALRNDSSIINDVGLVILDEGHMIGLNEREIHYEVQIQRLLRREDAKERRVVCLSAILPDGDELDDFVNWLRQDKVGDAIKSTWRPTNLRFGEINWYTDTGRIDFTIGDERPFIPNYIKPMIPSKPNPGRRTTPFPKNVQELTLAAAWRLVEEKHTVLIYCTQKSYVDSFAKVIIDLHKRGALKSVLSVNEEVLELARVLGHEWLGPNHPILECLNLGIAIHHGSLPTPYRKEIEKLLRDGILKITVSSPTLAQGLNLTATSVIVYSLYRSGKRIEASEFKNVVGRAGRAFIDTQGLVLHPIYEEHDWRKKKWNEIIEDSEARNMQSGLVLLVFSLIQRIAKKLNSNKTEEILEYILNNTNVWDFPIVDDEPTNEIEDQEMSWNKHLLNLDTAILSLLGDQDDSSNDIPNLLDKVLESSLWNRTLAREKSEDITTLFNSFLVERAQYVWSSTTNVQRMAYFLAGVGLSTGQQLDAISIDANIYLVNSNGYLLNKDYESAILEIEKLAEVIFKIEPFTPNILPQNWKNILRKWLNGETLTDDKNLDINSTLQFIEDGLVYRLPWGIEAIRVRALANHDKIDENSTIDDYELDLVVPAIENGSLNRSTAILMQAGFNSRNAAIHAIETTKADFTNSKELKQWLTSHEVKALSSQSDWPTVETHKMWISFIHDFQPTKQTIWHFKKATLQVRWDSGYEPISGTIIKINDLKDDISEVFGIDGNKIGVLTINYKIPKTGAYIVEISENINSLDVSYWGNERNIFIER